MVLSGIENALWDIAGQTHGVPVHALLGGAVHGELPVYGSGGPFTMSIPELVAQAVDTRCRGFRGFRLRVNFFRYQPDVEAERVAAVREALGRDMAVTIDAVQNYNPRPWSVKEAARMLRMLEPFDLAWAARMATDGFGASTRLVWHTFFPLMRPLLRRNMGVDAARVHRARKRLGGYLDRLESAIGPSGYLVGDRFSVADLAAAAVMTAIVRPPEFPYPLPDPWPPELVQLRESVAGRAGFRWVLDIYARHRRHVERDSRRVKPADRDGLGRSGPPEGGLYWLAGARIGAGASRGRPSCRQTALGEGAPRRTGQGGQVGHRLSRAARCGHALEHVGNSPPMSALGTITRFREAPRPQGRAAAAEPKGTQERS